MNDPDEVILKAILAKGIKHIIWIDDDQFHDVYDSLYLIKDYIYVIGVHNNMTNGPKNKSILSSDWYYEAVTEVVRDAADALITKTMFQLHYRLSREGYIFYGISNDKFIRKTAIALRKRGRKVIALNTGRKKFFQSYCVDFISELCKKEVEDINIEELIEEVDNKLWKTSYYK